MANYANTKSIIDANIFENHLNQVTAPMVKAAVYSVVDALIAGGYLYAGVAHPGDAASTPNANVCKIATEPGTYTNYKNSSNVSLVVEEGEAAVFRYHGSWNKTVTGLITNDTAKIVARGVYVDYRHIAEFVSSPPTFNEYKANSNYDALHIRLASGRGTLYVSGAVITRFAYFSSPELIQANYISQNTTGVIPAGARYVVVNLLRANNTAGYGNLLVYQDQNYVYKPDFYSTFGNYVRNVPTGKNYIDSASLAYGYQIANGRVTTNSNGILSNKIFLEDGETYTIQGIPYYGLYTRCYYAKYDINGKFISTTYVKVVDVNNDGRGTGSFMYSNNNGQVAFIRFCVQASTSVSFDASLAQLELGEPATAVEAYTGADKFFPTSGNNSAERRKARVLVVGNSYSQDAFDYVPYILPGLADIDAEVGILYHDGASLQQHYNWLVNDSAEYTFYFSDGKDAWQNLGTYSLKNALSYLDWDIVVLQQRGRLSPDYSSYQPYLNNLITEIYGALSFPVKFVWYAVMSAAAYNSGGTTYYYTDEEIVQNYENNCAAAQRVLNETLCEAVIPVATAVQNARTTTLDSVGNYGKLTYEGVHLQEGLPCQLAAYAVCMTIMSLCGFANRSIYGDTTRATSDWLSDKSMPGPNGSSTGVTDENCRLAQMSAIMAQRHPFQVTDISLL
jgi:hypothetical protein